MRAFWLCVAILVISGPGCSTTDDPAGTESPGAIPENTLPASGHWAEVNPGGDTICSRGTPYKFYMRGGRTDRLLIDFQGGGACWNELTCSVAGALFKEAVDDIDLITGGIDAGYVGGIFDPAESNLFHDWTLVHIPYCTGDIHWGNARHEYNDHLAIEHRGFINASAALSWVYENIVDPSLVTVTGCSAGAYGAILHSAYIARQYPNTKLAVLADSGGGVITDTFLADSMPNWAAEESVPAFIPDLDRPLLEMRLPDLYTAIGNFYPEHRFAQVSSAFDQNQTFYYTVMGGVHSEWPVAYRSSLQQIIERNDSENFRAYLMPGAVHCITPYPFMATRTLDGVAFSDWVRDLVMGGSLPETVMCEDDDCYADSVCDACEGDEQGMPWCPYCDGWPELYEPSAD